MRLFLALFLVFFTTTAFAQAPDLSGYAPLHQQEPPYQQQAPQQQQRQLPPIGYQQNYQNQLGGYKYQGPTSGQLGNNVNDQQYFMQDCLKQFESNVFLSIMGAALPPQKIQAYCQCNYNGLVQRGLMQQYWQYNRQTSTNQMQAAYNNPARPAIEQVTQSCGQQLQ